MEYYYRLDENSEESIEKFSRLILEKDEKAFYVEYLRSSLRKAIKTLNSIENYDSIKRLNKLITLIHTLAKFRPKDVVNETIVNDHEYFDLLNTYRRLIKYFLGSKNIDYYMLTTIFATLCQFTETYAMIQPYGRIPIHEDAVHILKNIHFMRDENIENDKLLELFHKIISFFSLTLTYDSKHHFKDYTLLEFVNNQLKILRSKLYIRNELSYIKFNYFIVMDTLCKEDEADMIKSVDEIVEISITYLARTIENYPTNEELIENSKFYFSYIFNSTIRYITAVKILRRIIKFSSKLIRREQLLNTNIFVHLDEFIEKGNDEEVELTCELICSLLFKDNENEVLKVNLNKVSESVKRILELTRNVRTKRYCKQILFLINPSFDQESTRNTNESPTMPNIMLSFNEGQGMRCRHLLSRINLRNLPINIQMDLQQDQYDSYENMIDTIKNASIVIICYSEEYKESVSSRFEAMYAVKLHKPLMLFKVQEKYTLDGWMYWYFKSHEILMQPYDGKNGIDEEFFKYFENQINLMLSNLDDPRFQASPSSTKIITPAARRKIII